MEVKDLDPDPPESLRAHVQPGQVSCALGGMSIPIPI